MKRSLRPAGAGSLRKTTHGKQGKPLGGKLGEIPRPPGRTPETGDDKRGGALVRREILRPLRRTQKDNGGTGQAAGEDDCGVRQMAVDCEQ